MTMSAESRMESLMLHTWMEACIYFRRHYVFVLYCPSADASVCPSIVSGHCLENPGRNNLKFVISSIIS